MQSYVMWHIASSWKISFPMFAFSSESTEITSGVWKPGPVTGTHLLLDLQLRFVVSEQICWCEFIVIPYQITEPTPAHSDSFGCCRNFQEHAPGGDYQKLEAIVCYFEEIKMNWIWQMQGGTNYGCIFYLSSMPRASVQTTDKDFFLMEGLPGSRSFVPFHSQTQFITTTAPCFRKFWSIENWLHFQRINEIQWEKDKPRNEQLMASSLQYKMHISLAGKSSPCAFYSKQNDCIFLGFHLIHFHFYYPSSFLLNKSDTDKMHDKTASAKIIFIYLFWFYLEIINNFIVMSLSLIGILPSRDCQDENKFVYG